jgi:DNA-binding transcriptional MerR regulator
MYRIGDFSALTQVPVRTLRYYDRRGVLRPAHVDRATRYRLYGADQLAQLNRILVLKDLGLSLAEICDHVADATPSSQLLAVVRRKHAELERRVEREQRRLSRAGARLMMMQRELATLPEVAVRHTGAQRVASLRRTVASYDHCDELFDELDHALRGRHHRRGQRGAIFHGCSPGAVDCEVFEIARDGAVGGRARITNLPARRVAVLIYRGDSEFLGVYRELRTWIELAGFAIIGPKRELYLASRDQAVTEVQFPIRAEA